MRRLSTLLAVTAVLTLVAVDDAWSARTGGRGGARAGFAGGGASRPGFAMHHHRGRAVFFVGAPFLFCTDIELNPMQVQETPRLD